MSRFSPSPYGDYDQENRGGIRVWNYRQDERLLKMDNDFKIIVEFKISRESVNETNKRLGKNDSDEKLAEDFISFLREDWDERVKITRIS